MGNNALAVALTELANSQAYGHDEVLLPQFLEDIDVRWDDGDRYNPTYGDSHTHPTLEVSLTYRVDRVVTRTRQVNAGQALTLLFKHAAGVLGG